MIKQQPDKLVFDFYTRNKELWQAMYEDCSRAEKRIHFTQYIIYNDMIGRKFLDIFEKKAKEGVDISLILDPVGSHMIRDTSHLDRIKAAGGHIFFYNDVKWYNIFTPARWFPRNHGKLMFIDEEITYIGGMCIADRMYNWHDLHARIFGRIDKSKDVDLVHSDRHPTHRARRQVYQSIISKINAADDYIYMVTPYCVPPKGLLKAWRRAAKRGVTLKLLISDRTDNAIADLVAKSYLRQLLKMGIEVSFYKEEILHAKYMIIDGKWATFGSTNLDYLSLCRNKEANVFVTDPPVIKTLKKIFKDMLAKSHKGSLKDWQDIFWWDKIIAIAGRIFRRFL